MLALQGVNILPQSLTLLLLLFIYFVVFLLCSFIAWKNQSARHTGFASRSRLLLVSYHVTSLIRLSLVACVCHFDNTALSHPVRHNLRLCYSRLIAGGIVDLHSKFGNKRTRFTHSQHRMAHTLRHFCSYSSIGTDTRCCSNGAGFLFDITIVRGFPQA